MELRILVDLRKDAAVQNLRNDARFDLLSEDIKAMAVAILDGQGQVFNRLDMLTQSVQKGQNETDMLIKQSRDKIVDAVAALTTSTRPWDVSRSQAKPITVPSKIADDVENTILEDLSFGRMELRERTVSPAHEATFRWILSDSPAQSRPWDNLIQWLRSGSGCYWVNGKAGSGKSTLMKLLTKQPETRVALEAWAGSNELLVVPFFFWNLGTELQKSQEGLLRSVLHSVLSKYRNLLAKVVSGYYNDVTRKLRHSDKLEQLPPVEPLTSVELRLAFLKMFEAMPENLRLCLFIDGVDEFSGDHSTLAELLKTVLSHKVKMVISSRPTSPCLTAFEEYPKLRLQDLTKGDIISYIHAQIRVQKYMQLLSKSQPEDVDGLVEEICSLSSGIFLWVVLVVKSLLQGLNAGDQMDDLKRRLYQYPRELEPLYKHMLDGVDELYRVQASKYLQIVLKSIEVQTFQPLSLLQMSFAEEDDMSTVLGMPSRVMSPMEVASRREAIGRRLISRCCGLIEAEDEELENEARLLTIYKDSAINFLHKSVVDFLRRPDIWAYIIGLTKDINYDTNWSLASSCLSMIKTLPLAVSITDSSRWMYGQYFLRYCRDGEKSSNKANLAFLHELSVVLSVLTEQWKSQSVVHDIPTLRAQLLPCLRAGIEIEQVPTFLALAACNYLPLHTQKALESYSPLYLEKEGAVLLWASVSPVTIISAAVESYLPALEETVKCLLKNGADPNLATGIQLSPWACVLSDICAFSDWEKGMRTLPQRGGLREFDIEVSASLTYLRIFELFVLRGAYVNAVIFLPTVKGGVDPFSWYVDAKTSSALSATAVIEEFFSVDIGAALRTSHRNSGIEKEIRGMKERLVDLLVKKGGKSRKWVDGKQVEGPPIETPLSVLVKQSSPSKTRREDAPASSKLSQKWGKGFRASFKEWRQPRSSSRGDR